MLNEHDSNPKPEEGREENVVQNEKAPDTEESFSFLTETIKPKSTSREKMFMQFGRMAVCGLIIGIFACCGFFALKPWAERTFRKDPGTVTIPADSEEEPGEENPEAEAEQEVQILDEESYRQMMDKLYLTAQEAKKTVVSVRVKTDRDWTEEVSKTESNTGSSAGIIAADNGQELLILADNSVCSEASEWEILFANGDSFPASLKTQDKNRGLAVFCISKEEIPDSTENQIQVAELGNSNLVIQGDVVIGLGNLFGYEEGLSYGVASSVEYSEIFSDGECGIIATDIAVAQSGTGILIDQEGNVIGLIRQGIFSHGDAEKQEVTANALAISDLKAVMELMLNGKKVPYAGVRGVTVTEDVAKEQEIPKGLYITQVESDSPAMAAGIQNGDVIQSVNGDTVTGITSFEATLLDCAIGDNVTVKGMRRGSDGYVEVMFSLSVDAKE